MSVTEKQRRRNIEHYNRIKEDLHEFVFEDPEVPGRSFRLDKDSECYARLVKCITNYFPDDCDADAEVERLKNPQTMAMALYTSITHGRFGPRFVGPFREEAKEWLQVAKRLIKELGL